MRAFAVALLCLGLAACAGERDQVQIGNRTIAVGPTRAIGGSNAFIAPLGHSSYFTNREVRTTGRAINDIRAYRNLKQSNPELFMAHYAATGASVQMTDRINRAVNGMISFEDDSAAHETWRALPRGGDGDCDDYAVTKLYYMIAVGTPRQNLRLTVATSKITGQWHLMLAVDIPGQGTLFMDSNNEDLLTATEARDLYTLWFMENTATLRMELVT